MEKVVLFSSCLKTGLAGPRRRGLRATPRLTQSLEAIASPRGAIPIVVLVVHATPDRAVRDDTTDSLAPSLTRRPIASVVLRDATTHTVARRSEAASPVIQTEGPNGVAAAVEVPRVGASAASGLGAQRAVAEAIGDVGTTDASCIPPASTADAAIPRVPVPLGGLRVAATTETDESTHPDVRVRALASIASAIGLLAIPSGTA